MSCSYILSYFKTDDESLFLARSNDGFSYTKLNDGNPVLRSHIGNSSIRDPFILNVAPDRFALLATDGFHGKSIFYSESENLVNWSEPKLISPFGRLSLARNVWAPKALLLEDGMIEIFWSTTISMIPRSRPNNHRIWSMCTRDFISFTKPQLRFDPGYNVIDFCPYYDGGLIHALFKDERGTYGVGSDVRAIRSVVGPYHSLSGGDISEPLTEKTTEGPCLFRLGGKWAMIYDKYEDGAWGGMISDDFLTWTSRQVSIPSGARHGSVINLNEDATIC